MARTIEHDGSTHPDGVAREATGGTHRLTGGRVWRTLSKASFAVLSWTTPAGEPRSCGVVYTVVSGRLYIAVAPNSWKARHIPVTGRVSMTVPVRRGGILALLVPIPPATISFHGSAIVHRAGAPEIRSISKELAPLLPPERRDSSCVIEVVPEGSFVTYGVGVPLMKLRDPAAARDRVPARLEQTTD